MRQSVTVVAAVLAVALLLAPSKSQPPAATPAAPPPWEYSAFTMKELLKDEPGEARAKRFAALMTGFDREGYELVGAFDVDDPAEEGDVLLFRQRAAK